MTRKLILFLTGTTILFWLIAAGVGALVMREEFDEVFDSALQETAQRLLPLVVNNLFQNDSLEGQLSVDISNPGKREYLTYQLRDIDGRIVLRSHDAQREPFDAPLKPGFYDMGDLRIYTEAAVSGTLFLQVADHLGNRREAVREGAASLLIPLIFLVPLSSIIVWGVVRSSLKPVDSLGKEIGARDGAHLSPMNLSELPVELQPIGVSVNRLFERLRIALDAERAFASNSAHELRTPIAGALAQTQRLLAELPGGAIKDRVVQLKEALSTLARLAEKLLQLARAESGIGLAVEPMDILPIIAVVIEDFARKPEVQQRLQYVNLTAENSIVRNIDLDATGIVFRNLIENALVHGESDGTVKVLVQENGTISIINDGPVVAPNVLQNLGQRFRRGNTSQHGSGLGLAIACMLVRQMGGTIHFLSPAKGRVGGFEAVVELA